MIRSLWIARTGLEAQQTQLDVISNNLANVSTNGFKRARAVFEDLLYQNLRQPGAQSTQQTTIPSGLQIGTGVKPVATERIFTQGTLQQTGGSLDVAVQGNGFFQISMPDGTTAYTRDGAFQLDSQGNVVTASGYTLADNINIPADALSVTIGKDGTVSVLQAGGCLLAITHDMAVAQALGGQVIVLRHGQAVEQGAIGKVAAQPQHPFTRQLMDADPARWLPFAAPQAGEPVVEARGISKTYGAQQLFAPMDLQIRSGERVAVQGPSGTGKSTLGNVLLGLLPPDTGSVARSQGLRPHAFQKLYQDPVGSFAPHISLAQSLRDAARLHRCDWKTVQRRLEQLRVPESLLERKPEQVSGGELQRIALARVLVAQPALLFADEPTSRLDPITQQEAIQILLSATQETGAALMLVTHDEHLAAAVATRRIGLTAGPTAGR